MDGNGEDLESEDEGEQSGNDEDNDDNNSWTDESQNSDDFEEGSDAWSQASELGIDLRVEFYPKESEKLDPFHKKRSYNPIKFQLRDAQWTNRCRILCIDAELKERKAFLSGRGRYDNYFDFRLVRAGNDPRDTEADSHPCCRSYEPKENATGFPMHEACFDVLTRCLGYGHRKDVDKDVLAV
jgi:hypothetical protein